MNQSKKMALVSFLAIFLFGLAVGVVVDRYVFENSHKPERRHDPSDFLFHKFSDNLSLDENQKLELKRLLEEIKEKHRAIRKSDRGRYNEIKKEFDDDFRKILTPDQVTKYNQMVKEFEEKRARVEAKRGDRK